MAAHLRRLCHRGSRGPAHRLGFRRLPPRPLADLVTAQSLPGWAKEGEDDHDEYGEEEEEAGEAFEEIHEFAGNATLSLILLHVAGVIAASLAHRENLVRAMITGRKRPTE